MNVRGSSLTQLAQRLSAFVDRSIVNKTETAGLFNFHLEFTPNPGMLGHGMPPGREGNPGAEPTSDSAPELFGALQEQLGLKLSPEKGRVGILIIDHAEKPSAN